MRAPRTRDRLDALRAQLDALWTAPVFDHVREAQLLSELRVEVALFREARREEART